MISLIKNFLVVLLHKQIKSAINCVIMTSHQLAEELQKPKIRTFKRQKVYSSFNHNVWGADLADMQLINK